MAKKAEPKQIEQTFVMIKPDGLQMGVVGEIIKRLEQRGLRLVAIKMMMGDDKLLDKHYRLTDEWVTSLAAKTRAAFKSKETDRQIAERVQNWLKDYIKEGPVVPMVWEGYHAIEIVRKIVGHTEPRQALPGTIRGDFTLESYAMADDKGRPLRNLVHASGNEDEAENEVKLWFKPSELHSYELERWRVMHR